MKYYRFGKDPSPGLPLSAVLKFVWQGKTNGHQSYQIFCSIDDLTGMAPVDKVTPEDYRRQYDVNVGGTFFACQVIVPVMK